MDNLKQSMETLRILFAVQGAAARELILINEGFQHGRQHLLNRSKLEAIQKSQIIVAECIRNLQPSK